MVRVALLSDVVSDDRLIVGLPCQNHLLVTGASAGFVDRVKEAVLSSPHPLDELTVSAPHRRASVTDDRPSSPRVGVTVDTVDMAMTLGLSEGTPKRWSGSAGDLDCRLAFINGATHDLVVRTVKGDLDQVADIAALLTTESGA